LGNLVLERIVLLAKEKTELSTKLYSAETTLQSDKAELDKLRAKNILLQAFKIQTEKE
jgi:hypothetical protein